MDEEGKERKGEDRSGSGENSGPGLVQTRHGER